MVRPIKCYEYYYEVYIDIMSEENWILRKVFYYSLYYLACVTMRLNTPLLLPVFRKPDVDHSYKDCRNYM